jgi:hypothetical protein
MSAANGPAPTDVTTSPVTSAKRGSVRPCETCDEAKPDGRRECGTCRIARYRQDPAKAARSRASSARWKTEQFTRELAQIANRYPMETR